MSEHAESGGATVGSMGARSSLNALMDGSSSHNTQEFGRNARVLDGLRAAETAFVYVCLQIWTTVDTTLRRNAYTMEQRGRTRVKPEWRKLPQNAELLA
jgi:hypothetical protein